MRRVERVIGEARTLRILRAARAQAPERLPESERGAADVWTRDCGVAARILADLSERMAPDGSLPAAVDGFVDGRRKGGLIDVFDATVLVPFMDAVQVAIGKVVADMDPEGCVVRAMEPAVLAVVYPLGVPEAIAALSRDDGSGSPPDPRLDPGRARRAAIADVAVLAWEMALLAAVRGVHRDNDMRRPFNPHADVSDVVVVGSSLKRPGKLKTDAARRLALRRGKLKAGKVSGDEVLSGDEVSAGKDGDPISADVVGAELGPDDGVPDDGVLPMVVAP